jgi:hypothetical protein
MLLKRAAAILIAVFLLLNISGCYTKLKSPEPRLVPDDPVIEGDAPEWDFGWGWYSPNWRTTNVYYDYYHISWWDECRWCDDESGPDIDLFEPTDKITHRDYFYTQPGVQIQGSPNGSYIPSEVIVVPSDPPAPQPIVQQKQPDNSRGNGDSSNSQNDSGKKIKRTGRR